MKYFTVFLLWLFLPSCFPQNETTEFQIAFKNDKSGKTLAGDKATLINAIRKGATIKIGWGGQGKEHRIEHLSEPVWIAVLDEEEVIAHLDPQVLAKVNWDDLTGDYADSSLLNQEWRVVISTKGEFDAIWYDRSNHQVIKRIPQNHPMTWFVKGVKMRKKAVPLFQNE